MKIKQLAIAIFSTVILTASSLATQPKDHLPIAPRFYVGVEFGGRYNDSYESERTRLIDEFGAGTTQVGVFTLSVDNDLGIDKISAAPWGWTVSGLAGYRLTNHWSVQLGYNQDQRQMLTGSLEGTVDVFHLGGLTEFGPERLKLKLKAEQLYLAAKATLPFVKDYDLYFMIGPAWTHLRQTAVLTETTEANSAQTDSFWSPMFAVGMSVNLSQNFDLSLQYMHIMADQSGENWSDLRHSYMGTKRMTVGINYLFDL